MSKLVSISSSIFRKQKTGADYHRPSGILKDTEVTVDAGMLATRIVPVGFMYNPSIHELEVYLEGAYMRADGPGFTGDYEEYSRTEVRFAPGVLNLSDRVRFRVTTAYYRNRSLALALDIFATGRISTSEYEIIVGDWVVSGGRYYADVSHSFNTQYLVVQCFDTSTTEQIIPLDIEMVDVDTCRIWMPINTVELYVILSR
jgi:hypothetical protein